MLLLSFAGWRRGAGVLALTWLATFAGWAQQSVLPASGITDFTLQRPDATYATVIKQSVSDQPFLQALRVTTLKVAAFPWDIQLNARTTAAVVSNDVLLASFYLRRVAGTNEGHLTFVFEKASPDYDKSANRSLPAENAAWRQFHVAFKSGADYAAGAAQINFQLGYDPQTIELGGLTVTNYGTRVPLESLPNDFNYVGREPDAPWRAPAAERIERLRKADLAIELRGPDGLPLPGSVAAEVRVQMQRHAFGFGSAVAGDRLLGTGTDPANYRRIVTNWFNKVVLENDLKWPNWEWRPQVAKNALAWLGARGLPVRGHNLIWPEWRWMPADVEALASQPEQLRQRIDAHFTDQLTAVRGKCVEWDVINEPYSEHQVMDVLGDAEMVRWYERSRALDPDTKLYLNDYGNLEEASLDSPHLNGTLRIIRYLRDHGAPLDGLGLQGHIGSHLSSADHLLAVLDRFSEFGLPLQVTEFDVNINDEATQADYLRDFMTAVFSHPQVNGILLWGFWEGQHWLPDAALFRRDWTIKPSGIAWTNLVFKEWWTDATAIADGAGRANFRGFKGDYVITVTVGGLSQRQAFGLLGDTRLVVTLTNLPPALKATRVEDELRLSWPAPAPGYQLEGKGAGPGSPWQAVPTLPVPTNERRTVAVPLQGLAMLFRLRQP